MSLTHTETFKISFNEEQLLKIVERYIESKYYEIRYSGLNLNSAIFNYDASGNIMCEVVYQKTIKQQETVEE